LTAVLKLPVVVGRGILFSKIATDTGAIRGVGDSAVRNASD
jgi:hypothetical protein